MGEFPYLNWFAKSPGLGYCGDMKYFAALTGLVVALCMPQAHAQSTPDEQYVAIYNNIQQADSLLTAGQTRQALNGYSQAQTDLLKFQKVYPDWNVRLVNYRVNYVAGKISDLTAKAPVATASVKAAPAASGSAQSAAGNAANAANDAQLQGLQSENDSLKAKLKEALSAQPAVGSAQELAMAQSQIKSLLKENELLRTSVSQAKGAPVAPAPAMSSTGTSMELSAAKARANQLAIENQSLQAKLQSTGANTDAAQSLKQENELLKRQLAAVQSASSKPAGSAGAEVDRLRAQVTALQSDFDVNWLEKMALEKRLQQSSGKSSSTPPTQPTPPPAVAAVSPAPAPAPAPAPQPAVATAPKPAPIAVPTPTPTPVATVAKATKPKNSKGKTNNAAKPTPTPTVVATAPAVNPAPAPTPTPTVVGKVPVTAPAASGNNASTVVQALDEIAAGKLDVAEQHLRDALAKSPDDAYTLSAYGYLKYRQRKYDDAYEALSRAAKLDPKNAQVQNYLGVTLSQKGQRADAEDALLKAVSIDPNYGAAHNNLAIIYLNDNPPKVDLAREHYQKALQTGLPHNANLEKMLASKGASLGQ